MNLRPPRTLRKYARPDAAHVCHRPTGNISLLDKVTSLLDKIAPPRKAIGRAVAQPIVRRCPSAFSSPCQHRAWRPGPVPLPSDSGWRRLWRYYLIGRCRVPPINPTGICGSIHANFIHGITRGVVRSLARAARNRADRTAAGIAVTGLGRRASSADRKRASRPQMDGRAAHR